MSNIKELNNEELEKVSGGKRDVGDYSVYKKSELAGISNNMQLCILRGTYNSNSYTLKENGKVTGKMTDPSSSKSGVVVEGLTSGNKYNFWNDGTCTLGISPIDYWIGTKNK